MKKRNLKTLMLNKSSISQLSVLELKGGAGSYHPKACNTRACNSEACPTEPSAANQCQP